MTGDGRRPDEVVEGEGAERRQEQEILTGLLAGDRAAFDALFHRHVHGLYHYAIARLGDGQAAQELVQATFLQALEGVRSFRGEGTLAAWLFGIIRFKLRAHLRRGRRRGEIPYEEMAGSSGEATGGGPPPDEELQRREIEARVHAALDVLPQRHADVLERKYLEGQSVKEIAGELGLSEKAVESLLSRARRAFRRSFLDLTPPRGGRS